MTKYIDADLFKNEDIITIHLGRVVSDEVCDQIVNDIVKLLERKYPSDANWYLDS